MTVAIIPGSERSDKEKKELLTFKTPTGGIDDFPSLVNAAKDAIDQEAQKGSATTS